MRVATDKHFDAMHISNQDLL